MADINATPKHVTGRLNRLWESTVNSAECRNPKILWDELWPRYNTVTIALLDENAFFADALSIAKHAKSSRELEELLAEKMRQRKDELKAVLDKMGLALLLHDDKLESVAARTAASKVVRTTSFDSCLQFVGGSMFGWAGDPMDDRKQVRKPLTQYGYASQGDEDWRLDYDFAQYDSDVGSLDESLFPMPTPIPIPIPTTSHHQDAAATATATPTLTTADTGAAATSDAEQPAVPLDTTGDGRTHTAPMPVEGPSTPTTIDVAASLSSRPLSPRLSIHSPSTAKAPDVPATPPLTNTPSTVSPVSTDKRLSSPAPSSQNFAYDARMQHAVNDDDSTVAFERVFGGDQDTGAGRAAGQTMGRKRRRVVASCSDDASNDKDRRSKRRKHVSDATSPHQPP